MKKTNMKAMLASVLILTFFGFSALNAVAKDIYPTKDITFVCYSNPGGGYDIFARGIAPFLTKHLRIVSPGATGGEIKVNNMVGAGGAKAITYLYKDAKPNGYTIGDFNRGNAFKFSAGSEKLPFDVGEVTYLASFAVSNRVLISRKFATWEDMIAAAKKEPLIFVSSNPGSAQNLDTIFFKEGVGLPGKIANAGGTPLAVAALIRGDGDVYVIDHASSKALIESKEVNALVTFTETRVEPQVPTVVEKGYSQLLESVGGKGSRLVIAPPKLDPEAKRILLAALKNVAADPEFQAFCKKMNFDLEPYFNKDAEKIIRDYIQLLKDNQETLKKYGLESKSKSKKG